MFCVVLVLGCLILIFMLRCLGCRMVGLIMFFWLEVLIMMIFLSFFILLILLSSCGIIVVLMFEEMLVLWVWKIEFILLKNMIIGVFFDVFLWVCWKISWMWCFVFLMNLFSSLGFLMLRKYDFVLWVLLLWILVIFLVNELVIVLVINVLL